MQVPRLLEQTVSDVRGFEISDQPGVSQNRAIRRLIQNHTQSSGSEAEEQSVTMGVLSLGDSFRGFRIDRGEFPRGGQRSAREQRQEYAGQARVEEDLRVGRLPGQRPREVPAGAGRTCSGYLIRCLRYWMAMTESTSLCRRLCI